MGYDHNTSRDRAKRALEVHRLKEEVPGWVKRIHQDYGQRAFSEPNYNHRIRTVVRHYMGLKLGLNVMEMAAITGFPWSWLHSAWWDIKKGKSR